jgi:hypothetical protein
MIINNNTNNFETSVFSHTQNFTIRNIYYHIEDEFRQMKNNIIELNIPTEENNGIYYSYNSDIININNKWKEYIDKNRLEIYKTPYLVEWVRTEFSHYIHFTPDEFKNSFNRKINRFLEYLNSDKKVLFVHFNKDYILLKQYRDNDNLLYEYLVKLDILFKNKYPNFNYKIINLHSGKIRENEGNIINYYIDIPENKLFVRDTEEGYINNLNNEVFENLEWYINKASFSLKHLLDIYS